MSFLISRVARSQAVMSGVKTGGLRNGTTRGFMASSVRGLKETDSHNPDQASQNEHHKQDQLAKQKEGKGHWKPELASDSEEAVNADRNHKDESPEALQEKTAHHAEEKHKAGTSQHDGFGGN